GLPPGRWVLRTDRPPLAAGGRTRPDALARDLLRIRGPVAALGRPQRSGHPLGAREGRAGTPKRGARAAAGRAGTPTARAAGGETARTRHRPVGLTGPHRPRAPFLAGGRLSGAALPPRSSSPIE